MDWGELNPEILCKIAGKVGDISNFIRLRAVCKWWRSAVHPSDLPPQVPFWIESKLKGRSFSDLRLHSLFSNKTHTIPIPEGNHWSMVGSSIGYVLLWTSPDSPALLFNPMTGLIVAIPLEGRRYKLYSGPSPSENGINVVFDMLDLHVNQPSGWRVSLWQYTEGRWTDIIEMPYGDEAIISHYNGRFYCFSKSNGETRVIDATSGDVVSVIPASSVKLDFLIEACGDLLGLAMCASHDLTNYQIDVYRLDDSAENSYWAKVNNGIGDRILFLDYYKGFCLKASDFDGLRGNCIYFPGNATPYDCRRTRGALLRYDIGDCKTEALRFFEDYEGGTWFVPSLS